MPLELLLGRNAYRLRNERGLPLAAAEAAAGSATAGAGDIGAQAAAGGALAAAEAWLGSAGEEAAGGECPPGCTEHDHGHQGHSHHHHHHSGHHHLQGHQGGGATLGSWHDGRITTVSLRLQGSCLDLQRFTIWVESLLWGPAGHATTEAAGSSGTPKGSSSGGDGAGESTGGGGSAQVQAPAEVLRMKGVLAVAGSSRMHMVQVGWLSPGLCVDFTAVIP